MLGHDFIDMPGRSTEIGDNPRETIMLLRCKWCHKTPSKAREDGCPARELVELGKIVLSVFNPNGMAYFKGRKCVTCSGEIMDHWLRTPFERLSTATYWCDEGGIQASEGITDCLFEVAGITVPQEETTAKQPSIDLKVNYTSGDKT